MSKRLLTLFSGVIVLLLLFASAPAEAQNVFYRSNLVCSINGVPIAASGFVNINNRGDLDVDLRGLNLDPHPPVPIKFSCAVFCPLTHTAVQDLDCGGRVVTNNGTTYKTTSYGLAAIPTAQGNIGLLSPLCAEPSVEVVQEPFGVGKVFCDSGFVTPTP